MFLVLVLGYVKLMIKVIAWAALEIGMSAFIGTNWRMNKREMSLDYVDSGRIKLLD